MIRLFVTVSGLPSPSASAWQRVLPKFAERAGPLVVAKVQELLGTAALGYELKESYLEAKPKRKGFRRYGGKAWGQPLIFSGAMLEHLAFRRDGDTVVIGVEEGEALGKDGEDYAELWQEKVDYLGKGLEVAEPELEELLLDIVCEELGL